MTLDEIKATDKPYLLAKDIAPLMECDAQWIREMARKEKLPFRTERRGKKKIVIPRMEFIRYREEMCGC